MSAPSKRRASSNEEELQAKLSKNNLQADSLNKFLTWADSKDLNLNVKVTVCREGSCAQYGMMAADDIEEGEVLFQVPRDVLLHPGTSVIKGLLEEKKSSLESKSGWVPLLVSLMYEYNNPASLWRPYLDLVPDFKELDLPMFWTSSERENLLSGTGVPASVTSDLENIEAEFTKVVLPFVQRHSEKFSPVCKDLEFYKKMVAFVMAYSFTEPVQKHNQTSDVTDQSAIDSDEDDAVEEVMSPPMMVPMADILNHIAKNNARLTFEKESLKMVATKKIRKGEEVFNTYGELSNSHLLHMYGFAEEYPNNDFDEVSIYGETVMKVARELPCNTDDIVNKKKTLLKDMGLLDTSFIIGMDGVLTEDEMNQVLKIWTMSNDELAAFMENEGWEEEDLEEMLSFDCGMEKLPGDIKTLLSSCASESLKRYKTGIEEDEAILKTDTVTDRQRYSLYVNIGQKKILRKIIDCCR